MALSSNSVKSFLQSKTIWGGVLVVVSSFLGILGYNVDADTQNAILQILHESGNLIASIGTLSGGAITIYGRVKATKKIK